MLSFGLLVLSLVAASTSAQIPRQLNYCAGDKSTVGYCETLTFTDVTASSPKAPPTESECQDTCRRSIFGEAGDWIVKFEDSQPSDYRQNMLGNPCGFSVGRAPNQPASYSFSMANQDIADIVDEAVKRFAGLHGGKVTAQGLMTCEGWNATWFIKRF